MTKITTLANGDVRVIQTYFDGVEMATLRRTYQARGHYVYRVYPNGAIAQVCEGLQPTGPTLHCGSDLAKSIRATLR